MERIHGEAEVAARGGEIDGRMHLSGGPTGEPQNEENGSSRIGALRSDAMDRIEDVRDRASELADRARDRIHDSYDRVNDGLYGPTGLVPTVRERPLVSVAVAFSTGFVVAALTGPRKRNWIVERARKQLRAVIISGVTAALTHELRAVVGVENGLGDLVESFLSDDEDDDNDEEEYDLA
jgi:ElaB/YqjD/DUF883 family membrane-anchored ribosome-binding protein